MFEIKILDQYWADKQASSPDSHSHGFFLLKINNVVISNEKDSDWIISITALQLLRTITTNHYLNKENPIIRHSLQTDSTICPISIDWQSITEDRIIRISDFQKVRTTDEKDVINYSNLITTVDMTTYVKEIITFTGEVIKFFGGHNPQFSSDGEKKSYISFWQELYQLYNINK